MAPRPQPNHRAQLNDHRITRPLGPNLNLAVVASTRMTATYTASAQKLKKLIVDRLQGIAAAAVKEFVAIEFSRHLRLGVGCIYVTRAAGRHYESSKPAPLLIAYSSFSRSVDVRRKLGSFRVLLRGKASGEGGTSRNQHMLPGGAGCMVWGGEGALLPCRTDSASLLFPINGPAGRQQLTPRFQPHSCQFRRGCKAHLQVEAVGRRSTSLPPTEASREAPQSTCSPGQRQASHINKTAGVQFCVLTGKVGRLPQTTARLRVKRRRAARRGAAAAASSRVAPCGW